MNDIKDEIDLSDSNSIEELSPSIEKVSSSRHNKVWLNETMKPIKPPIVAYVPMNILTLMRSIEAKMGNGKLEFGVFLKGEFRENSLHISEEYVVLKQKVTGATIDFIEEAPPEFNGIIHRHPGGCTRFSGTDDSSININYEFSLLYVNNSITYGIINLLLDNGMRLQVELSPRILYPIVGNIDSLVSNIIEHKPVFPKMKTMNRNFPSVLIDNDIPVFEQIGKGSSSSEDDLFGDLEDLLEEDEPDEIWQLGDGYYFDGKFVYDSQHEIVEEHELPQHIQNELIRVSEEEIGDEYEFPDE